MVALPAFSSSLERTGWVQTQLRLVRSSFSAIALAKGVSRQAVSNAMTTPSEAMEKAIAEALGISQEALFPERYDSEGQRLHAIKNRAVRRPRNVKNRRAA